MYVARDKDDVLWFYENAPGRGLNHWLGTGDMIKWKTFMGSDPFPDLGWTDEPLYIDDLTTHLRFITIPDAEDRMLDVIDTLFDSERALATKIFRCMFDNRLDLKGAKEIVDVIDMALKAKEAPSPKDDPGAVPVRDSCNLCAPPNTKEIARLRGEIIGMRLLLVEVASAMDSVLSTICSEDEVADEQVQAMAALMIRMGYAR
mgnify:CR=1 FL=1